MIDILIISSRILWTLTIMSAIKYGIEITIGGIQLAIEKGNK